MNKTIIFGQSISWNLLLLSLIVACIPFPIKMGNAAMILGVLFVVYQLIVKQIKLDRKKIWSFAIISPILFFILILISALFSQDISAGLKQVEKNLLLILMPFILIGIYPPTKVDRKFVIRVFSFASIISFFILFIVAIFRIIGGANFDVLFFHELGAFFDLHPVYIAINLCIAIYFLSFYYKKQVPMSRGALIFLILIISFGLFGLFLCASKVVILVFIPLYFIKLLQGALKKNTLSIILLLILLSNVFVFKSSIVSDRFSDGLTFDIETFQPTSEIALSKVFSNEEKEKISDLELRYLMLKIGTFHLQNDGKLLFGYGIGDVQEYIDYYYMQYGLAPGWFEGYNLHNQYLQYLVTCGALGFTLFIIYLIYSLYFAIKNKESLHLFFLILILTIFLFECVLSRNKGIVIFIFMNTFFMMKYENSFIRN